MVIKIMSYNLAFGFHERVNFKDGLWNFKYHIERQRNAQKIIRKENPDILVLCEACFAEPNWRGILIDYKKIFGFKHIHHHDDVFIMSKFPIIYARGYGGNEQKFVRGIGIKAQIKVNGKRLHINAIHPTYDVKDEDKIKFIDYIIKDKESRSIIIGDFNAFSDEDDYELKDLIESFKITKPNKDYVGLARNFMGRKLIPHIKRKGYRDSFSIKERSFTFPTKLIMKKGIFPSRIDYIFIGKKIKVLEAGVVKNDCADKASDHYPVYALLEIK